MVKNCEKMNPGNSAGISGDSAEILGNSAAIVHHIFPKKVKKTATEPFFGTLHTIGWLTASNWH